MMSALPSPLTSATMMFTTSPSQILLVGWPRPLALLLESCGPSVNDPSPSERKTWMDLVLFPKAQVPYSWRMMSDLPSPSTSATNILTTSPFQEGPRPVALKVEGSCGPKLKLPSPVELAKYTWICASPSFAPGPPPFSMRNRSD